MGGELIVEAREMAIWQRRASEWPRNVVACALRDEEQRGGPAGTY
jgi:hypothetical protein